MVKKTTHWLKRRLAHLGKTARAAAQHLGLPPTRITEMQTGVRQIQVSELQPLAEFLEWTIPELLSAMGLGNSPGVSGSRPFLASGVRGLLQ